MYQRALEIAQKAHSGQTDKSGNAYINHPLAVSGMVDTEDEKIVALLHDVLEDSPYTLADLQQAGFSERVLEAVQALTRDDTEDYFDYIARVKENPLATAVKLADLKHNSDISRIPALTDKDVARLNKYRKAQEILQA